VLSTGKEPADQRDEPAQTPVIVSQVGDELTDPGQIRVTVIRESRAIEFAR
jgi:hypothetical protein